MFNERLMQLKNRIQGTLALALVAKDGIPVEWVSTQGRLELDLELIAAELMSQIRAISQNHQELSVGDVRHIAVNTDRMTLMVSRVTNDYFLLLILRAGSNQGLARFELRRAVLLFEQDLL